MTTLKKGDKVTWHSSQGEITGTVQQKLTQDTTLAGKKYKATKENPKVKVQSDKTKKQAIHNEDSVSKK